ncbi:MAG: hypothetical protein U9Q69_01510 [Nanoarchaeota archaeon]|nr:hypothetical protein [Nanoarchaeota archaeon]
MKKFTSLLILGMLLCSTLVAAGFLESITGALSFRWIPFFNKESLVLEQSDCWAVNDVCEVTKGETSVNCPEDCAVHSGCSAIVEPSQYPKYHVMEGQCIKYEGSKAIKVRNIDWDLDSNLKAIEINVGGGSVVDDSGQVQPDIDVLKLDSKIVKDGFAITLLGVYKTMDNDKEVKVAYIKVNPVNEEETEATSSKSDQLKCEEACSGKCFQKCKGMLAHCTVDCMSECLTACNERYPLNEEKTEETALPPSAGRGETYTLFEGGKAVEVAGKNVKLVSVGTSSLIVEVDDKAASMSTTSGSSNIINGIEVIVKSVVIKTNYGESSAVLELREESSLGGVEAEINEEAIAVLTSKKCKVLSHSDFESDLGKTGDAICAKYGKTCQWVAFRQTITYLDSTDGSCSGKRQTMAMFPYYNNCKFVVKATDTACDRYNNDDTFVEPMFGDANRIASPTEIICC